MKSETFNWGILGCGSIAHQFAESLKLIPNAKLISVASKSGKHVKFGEKYEAENRYDNYEQLASDPNVDAIYIATIHNLHYENAKLCLEGKKPVLCEKPFTLNAIQAEDLINIARRNNLFLMEGMWTRFIPCVEKIREMVNIDKKLGEVLLIKADFGFKFPYGPEHRGFNPKLAGGSLLDLGIYPISFSSMLLGKPTKISSSAIIGETGVDIVSSYFFEYDNGATAMLTSSNKLNMPHKALIIGTEGYLEVLNFSRPWKMDYFNGKEIETIEIPYDKPGFQFEAIEAMNCIKKGKLESEIMPLDESLEIMKTMDTLRNQWGLKYPEEK